MFAITGLIGSGKSFVSSVIREAGFDVLDADALVHELYKENAQLREKIAEEFGSEALNENGVNRAYISSLVFSNPQKLGILESFVYPVLASEIKRRKPDFVEAAVLYKTPEWEKKMKQIWLVDTDEHLRMERIASRNLTCLPVQRIGYHTKIIENNGTKKQCKKKVLELLNIPSIVKKNISLKKYTTFKIGGNAKFFAEPKKVGEICTLLAWCKEFEIPYIVLGKGSNVLFEDYNGLVIKWGTRLHDLIQDAANRGLGGLEKLDGIPGSIGGAIFMNAGAHGQQISDCIKSVTSITEDGEIKIRTKAQCEFSYRSSVFKNLHEIIFSAEFDFIHMPKETIDKNRKEVQVSRRIKQPLQYPNAGSIFKNPESKSAGALIEACGLKGYQIGDAQVSELHANFIVNKGNATAKDVKALMEKIAQEVKRVHGIELEKEIWIP